ncbi:MAG: hypothetical protein M0000_05535 [Actinomycetota bacterium]|nr:hypothetical protein [Actinomycetota bacterium]
MRLVPRHRSDAALAAIIAVTFLSAALAISLGAQIVLPVHGWLYSTDFFALMRDAHTILWGGFGIFYSPGVGQTPHPLGALSLVPLAEFSNLMHYVEPFPYPLPRPAIWLWGLGYMAVYLFVYVLAVLATYRRLGLPLARRPWVASASAALAAFCLFPWGHPEDVAAMALALFAFSSLRDGASIRGAYLAGAAAAFQPLTLLFLMPLVLIEVRGRGRLKAFTLRAAIIPLAVALPAMAGNFSASLSAILAEPQTARLRFNRPTLLDSLLQAHHNTISTGWFRVAMLLIALAVGIALRLAWRNRAVGARTTLAVCTAVLSLRAFIEPTQVAYYLSPYLAFGAIVLIGAMPRPRLAAVGWTAFGFGQLAVAMSRASALSYSLALWPLSLAGLLAILMIVNWQESQAEPYDAPSAPAQPPPFRCPSEGARLEEVGG